MLVETKGTDVLADVLNSLKLRGRLFCRCELSAPWAIGFPAGVFSHFHVIARGNCWLRLDGQADAIALEEGDLLLVTRGHRYQLSDDPSTPPVPLPDLVGDSRGGLRAVLQHGGGGQAVALICGGFEFDAPGSTQEAPSGATWCRDLDCRLSFRSMSTSIPPAASCEREAVPVRAR
jgi:hypothetical protein